MQQATDIDDTDTDVDTGGDGYWVTDRLGGRKLVPFRNNGGFCAAGENFSKNDQDQ